jgi:hypothetical protein
MIDLISEKTFSACISNTKKGKFPLFFAVSALNSQNCIKQGPYVPCELGSISSIFYEQLLQAKILQAQKRLIT